MRPAGSIGTAAPVVPDLLDSHTPMSREGTTHADAAGPEIRVPSGTRDVALTVPD